MTKGAQIDWIEDVAALEARYGAVSNAARAKVAPRLTPHYRAWIEASRFCVLASVGAGGTDASPRGDEGAVVRVLDAATLALPDWNGNNRIDSLRNILADPRVSLLFLVPGSGNVVRVNGRARITADDALRAGFARGERLPRTVVVVTIEEVYFQCSRALLRSRLWSGEDESARVPSAGDLLAEATRGEIDAPAYDADWARRAGEGLW